MKQTLQGNNPNRKHDYGYGVIDKTEFPSERKSRVVEREGKGRNRCVRERVEVVHVFEELQLAVVLENQ
jgi:hypothetical protein